MKLLEQTLRARGWDDAIYLRPTLAMVHEVIPERPAQQRFRQALLEMETFLDGRVPHVTLGFSFGGLLAAFAPSTRRMAVCSPWNLVPADALIRTSARPGLAVLQGGCDTMVSPESSLKALPINVPRTLDPEGTHAFDEWMDRIAAWTQTTWQA